MFLFLLSLALSYKSYLIDVRKSLKHEIQLLSQEIQLLQGILQNSDSFDNGSLFGLKENHKTNEIPIFADSIGRRTAYQSKQVLPLLFTPQYDNQKRYSRGNLKFQYDIPVYVTPTRSWRPIIGDDMPAFTSTPMSNVDIGTAAIQIPVMYFNATLRPFPPNSIGKHYKTTPKPIRLTNYSFYNNGMKNSFKIIPKPIRSFNSSFYQNVQPQAISLDTSHYPSFTPTTIYKPGRVHNLTRVYFNFQPQTISLDTPFVDTRKYIFPPFIRQMPSSLMYRKKHGGFFPENDSF